MQTFMLENYEGYMIWFLLQRDYEQINIYRYHPLYTSIHNERKINITRAFSLELY